MTKTNAAPTKQEIDSHILVDKVYTILVRNSPRTPLYDIATEIVTLVSKELSTDLKNSSQKFSESSYDDFVAPFQGSMKGDE